MCCRMASRQSTGSRSNLGATATCAWQPAPTALSRAFQRFSLTIRVALLHVSSRRHPHRHRRLCTHCALAWRQLHGGRVCRWDFDGSDHLRAAQAAEGPVVRRRMLLGCISRGCSRGTRGLNAPASATIGRVHCASSARRLLLSFARSRRGPQAHVDDCGWAQLHLPAGACALASAALSKESRRTQWPPQAISEGARRVL